MKLTKQRLKEIIKEEIQKLNEDSAEYKKYKKIGHEAYMKELDQYMKELDKDMKALTKLTNKWQNKKKPGK